MRSEFFIDRLQPDGSAYELGELSACFSRWLSGLLPMILRSARYFETASSFGVQQRVSVLNMVYGLELLHQRQGKPRHLAL